MCSTFHGQCIQACSTCLKGCHESAMLVCMQDVPSVELAMGTTYNGYLK